MTQGRTSSDTPLTPFPLRTASRQELRAFLGPLDRAFGEEYTDAEFEADAHTFEPDRIVAAFDGDRSVGCAGAYSVRLTVPGGEVAAAGVTLVGVLPTHRRRGILRSLMRQQLDDVRGRGESVAILWASEGAIYQRFGYGLAALQGSFEIERTRARFIHPAGPVGRARFVGPDEAERLFPPVYEALRRTTPGAISRSEAWWQWSTLRDAESARRENGPKYLVALEVDGRPAGYVIYRVKSDWDERGPNNKLTVLELVAGDPAAERDLWRWVLDIDLVGRIRGYRQPVPPTLFYLLAEPRRLGLTIGDGLWLRLVDLPAALAARSYAAPGSLVLDVTDDFCPWNAGRWRLEVGADADRSGRDGPARVEPTDAGPDLVLDVADLGAAYLGGTRFESLRGADRVAERRAGAIRLADAMFASGRTPWCSTMF